MRYAPMRSFRLRWILTAVFAGALAVAGCSGQRLVFADAVEGTLTLDGAAVPDALVEFFPDVPDGTRVPGSSGMTDAKGYFRLTRSDNQKPGALVGRHKVVVFPGRAAADRDAPAPAAPSRVPAVYMSAAQTPLIIEVTQDRKTYDLNMKRFGGPAR